MAAFVYRLASWHKANYAIAFFFVFGRYAGRLGLPLRRLLAIPIRERIVYKICTIVWKCVLGTAPSYLAEMYTAVAACSTGRRNLRPATHGDRLCPERERWPMDHAVLQSLDSVSAMICHRPCVHTQTVPKHTEDCFVQLVASLGL